jgi:hypothetical protein
MHSRLRLDELTRIVDAIEDAVGHSKNSSVQPTVLGGTQ